VPGGGQIGYETKEGFIKVPDEDNGTEAITIPSKVNKDTGCIDFNFFVAGGFSTPIYAKVVEADSLFKNNTDPVNSDNSN